MENTRTYVYEYIDKATGKPIKQIKRYVPKLSYKKERIEMMRIIKEMPMDDKYMDFYNSFMELVKNKQFAKVEN